MNTGHVPPNCPVHLTHTWARGEAEAGGREGPDPREGLPGSALRAPGVEREGGASE